MSLPIFGAQAAVSILNRVFTNTSPAASVFNNQVSNATSSLPAGTDSTDVLSYTAFAKTFGTAYASQSASALSTLILTNMGLLPNDGLQVGLADYLTNVGKENVGIVALQLSSIISGMGSSPTYGAASVAWNAEVTSAFTYSSNPANTAGQTGDVAAPPANQGQTFVLTLNQDALTGTGGDDTFNATALQDNNAKLNNSLQSVDSVNGGAGVDTINITLSGAGATPTLTSVEKVLVTAADAQTLTLTNATGVTDITVTGGAATATVAGVGAVANLAVTSTKQSATFTGNKATAVNLTTTDAGTVSATAPVVSTVTLDDVPTSLALTTSNSNVKLATAAKVATLTVAATGSNVFDTNSAAGAVKTITATGAGSVDMTATAFTALTTVDASANTGGVKVKADAKLVTFTGGAGADAVTFTAAAAATAVIKLGEGNDTVTIAAASSKGAVIDAGAGANTLAVTDGAFLDANATKTYTGFQTLEIGGGTGIYDTSLVTGINAVSLSSDALAGNAILNNVAAGTTLTVNAKASTNLATTKDITYTLKDATGTADSLSLTLNAKDGDNDAAAEGQVTVTKLVANGIESVSVASNVTGLDTGLAATKYTNTISALNGDAIKTLTVTGDANLAVTATNATTITKVNASAANGGLTLDLSGGASSVEFLGGAAKDTYVATTKGDTINAGKGGDAITVTGFGATDTFILKAGDSQLTVKADAFDTITNFGTAAGAGALDIIDLGAFAFTATQKSALANKGALANSVVDGSVLTQAAFFTSGGADRGVAIGTNGGATYVFVDVNKDANFDAATDLIIKLAGVTDVTLSNFGF